MADRGEVLELLRIADLATQWPNLKPLHDHAMTQLTKISGEHAKADAEAKAKDEEDAKAAAEKEAAAAKKEAEKDEPKPQPARAFQPTGGQRA